MDFMIHVSEHLYKFLMVLFPLGYIILTVIPFGYLFIKWEKGEYYIWPAITWISCTLLLGIWLITGITP